MNIIDALCGNSVYPEQVSVAFTRLSLPFALSSYLLIILYWHEMMTSATIVVHPFVVKMRIPFFVLSGALMVVQLIQIFLRSFTPIENSILITGTIIILLHLKLNIMFAFTDWLIEFSLNRCHVHYCLSGRCCIPCDYRHQAVAKITFEQTFRTSSQTAKGNY